jgi:hypothetical protein
MKRKKNSWTLENKKNNNEKQTPTDIFVKPCKA